MFVQVGDIVRVTKGPHVYEGILMPSEGAAKDEIIILKLDTGYNVGFLKSAVSVELVDSGRGFDARMPEVEIPYDESLSSVAILGTGGTVASKIDYSTGAVYPAFSPEELLMLVPELGSLANIYGKEVLSIVSEDVTMKDWAHIGASVVDHISQGFEGVVVTHGTDTLHYSSAMLSFMLKDLSCPVVIVGAQRSSDRPSSDAAFNLISAVNTSTSDCAEVVVCMHGSLSDRYCSIHRGTRARKFHTSRRDAFVSVNSRPLAKVSGAGAIEWNGPYSKAGGEDTYLDPAVDEKVSLVKAYPGAQDVLSALVDKDYHGIIIEGTGLGHAPASMHEDIRRGIEQGISFGMTSQCINGRVNMNVYRGGRQLKEMGVMPLEDMLGEVAWCKMAWGLAHYSPGGELETFMKTPVAGEMGATSRTDCYLGGSW